MTPFQYNKTNHKYNWQWKEMTESSEISQRCLQSIQFLWFTLCIFLSDVFSSWHAGRWLNSFISLLLHGLQTTITKMSVTTLSYLIANNVYSHVNSFVQLSQNQQLIKCKHCVEISIRKLKMSCSIVFLSSNSQNLVLGWTSAAPSFLGSYRWILSVMFWSEENCFKKLLPLSLFKKKKSGICDYAW